MRLFIIPVLLLLLNSCAIIRQGEVGVKTTLGKMRPNIINSGPYAYNPLFSKIIRLPVQTVNLQVNLDLPSKEGVNVKSEISILYHISPEKVPHIVETIGLNYENSIILSVFRSASADVCSRFLAKDMHTDKRAEIEKQIASHMTNILKERGFEIEAVLLKSIQLPKSLYSAIESKLEAEQRAQQMEFELQRERLEAQRRKIEAEGIRDAQRIISEGLTKEVIQWRSIEALQELSRSQNSKLIITDGNVPFLINPQEDK